MWIHVGRFDDFKGAQTLLIDADAEGIREFGRTLCLLVDGSATRIDVHRMPGVSAHGDVQVIVSTGEYGDDWWKTKAGDAR